MGKALLTFMTEVSARKNELATSHIRVKTGPHFPSRMLIFVGEFHNYSQDAEKSCDASSPALPIPHGSQVAPDISSVDSVGDVLGSRD